MMNSRSDDEPFIMDEEEPADDGLFVDSDDERANKGPSYENGGYKTPDLVSQQVQRATYENTADDAYDERVGSTTADYSLRFEYPTLPMQTYEVPSTVYVPSYKISRYKDSAKHLIPFRKSDKSKERMPIDDAGFFSFISYSWMTQFMRKSHSQSLIADDIPQCSKEDSCDYSSQRLEFFWKDEIARNGLKNASLKKAVWKFARTRILIDMILYLLSLTFGFLGPIFLMRRLLQFCEDAVAQRWQGATWVVAITMSELLRVFLFGVTWGVAYRTGIRVRSALTTLLYKKVMKLQSVGSVSSGELTNMIANDGQRIYDGIVLGPMVIGGPYVATVGAAYILTLLGPSALFGILVFVLFYPLQYGISSLIGFLRRRAIKVTDSRIKHTEEMITWIRLIKYYAWEKPFANTILSIRRREKEFLEKAAIIQSFGIALAPSIPVIAIIVTFLSYIAMGNELSPSMAFTVVTVYYSLRGSLSMAQWSSDSIMTLLVSLSRFQSVLQQEERKNYFHHPLDQTIAIAVSDATFAWQVIDSKKENATGGSSLPGPFMTPLSVALLDINILIPKGELVGICGPVGSGKSSLISALLGQLSIERGQISIDGSFAYVSQEPWISNCSLRENILCGEVFDPRRFYNVVHACALGQDINLFPAGDETEIGERGINLSGGQRQRIAMARALYANKDIYLLDDPLSAVDNEVGQHIFENCIRGGLKNKTVLLVTHQLHYLTRCDKVVFLDQGRLVAQGEHPVLLANNQKYREFCDTYNRETYDLANKANITPQPKGSLSGNSFVLANQEDNLNGPSDKSGERDSGGITTSEETNNSGAIPLPTYLYYMECAGGVAAVSSILLFFMINVSSIGLSSWWLAHWLNTGVGYINSTSGNVTEVYISIQSHPDILYYEVVYGTFIVLILLSSLIRSFLFMKASLRASNKIHTDLFYKVLKSPMSFFDTTPIGRLLNHFSKDMDELDGRLPSTVESVLQNMLLIFVTIILIIMVLPWFVVPFAAFTFIFVFFSRIFRAAARDLKRMENSSRSPIFSHVSATLSGLNTIRAFCKESDFVSKFMTLYDENSTSFFLFQCSMRWLAVRLDIISVCIVAVVASLVVVFHSWVPAAFAGLALAYSNQLTGMLQYTVRLITEAESRFLSVQRIHSCIANCKPEATPFIEDNRLARDWPRDGSIRFINVQMRYRPKLPFALNGVNFDVESGEKIGVVGRTGSGKSSLGVSLFRLVELSAGEIRIGNVNIAQIDLETLRSSLSIIPQDPLLFMGTIRYNLDPFSEKMDPELWEALEQIGMKEKVALLSHGLDTLIDGKNCAFSAGERQLFCMARVLLRKSKIILLDEATAAIDAQTTALIQQALLNVFKNCTVVTIAHRLNTVLGCDKVIVMSDGKVVEFDRPSTLIGNPDSIFSKMLSFYEDAPIAKFSI